MDSDRIWALIYMILMPSSIIFGILILLFGLNTFIIEGLACVLIIVPTISYTRVLTIYFFMQELEIEEDEEEDDEEDIK